MMQVTLWGTRGSLASPGPETARYGGNTACVEVQGSQGTTLVLDAGTGIRRLGIALSAPKQRLDILLTHLHLDHIQGLGFFGPLYSSNIHVHIWAPSSAKSSVYSRLMRYLSPPLFPVYLRDLPCKLSLHEVAEGDMEIGEFHISASRICHPGLTLGYRISTTKSSLAYLPDHEPALGARVFPLSGDWTSGYTLAANTDLLLHDAQYTDREHAEHRGWGHSSLRQAVQFAALAGTRHLVAFHHDPARTDADLDRSHAEALAMANRAFEVSIAAEGAIYQLD